jgi:hypothetical protein
MMDLTTALIGLVIVAMCILPIIYFNAAQKNKRKKFLNDFLALAGQQQLKISQHEVWSNYCAIGIDSDSNKLFYFKKRGDKEEQVLLSLLDIDKCRAINTKRVQNEDQIIDRLELGLSFKNNRISEKTLEFYSKDESMALDMELQLLDKWQKLITAQLEGKRKLAMVS